MVWLNVLSLDVSDKQKTQRWLWTTSVAHPLYTIINQSYLADTDTLHPTSSVAYTTGLCANTRGHWWSPFWLHTCRYHIQTHSRSARDGPLQNPDPLISLFQQQRKKQHYGSNSLSGVGLHPEFDRGGGSHCCDGYGPVGDWRPLRQPCDGRVLVLRPVEVVCPAELRVHRVPSLFHHSWTARYVFRSQTLISAGRHSCGFIFSDMLLS